LEDSTGRIYEIIGSRRGDSTPSGEIYGASRYVCAIPSEPSIKIGRYVV
jgi:hypothetical protein